MSDREEFFQRLKKKSSSQIIKEILSRLGVNENIIGLVLHQSRIQEEVLYIFNSILQSRQVPTIPMPGEEGQEFRANGIISYPMNGNENEIANAVEKLKENPVLGIGSVKARMLLAINSEGFETVTYRGISVDNDGNIITRSVECQNLKYKDKDCRYLCEREKIYTYNAKKDKIERKHKTHKVADTTQDKSVLMDGISHFIENEDISEREYTSDGRIKLKSKRTESQKTFEGEKSDTKFVDTWTRDSQFPIIAILEENLNGEKIKTIFQLAINDSPRGIRTTEARIFETREEAIAYCIEHQAEIMETIRQNPNGEAIIKSLKGVNIEGWNIQDDLTGHEAPGE